MQLEFEICSIYHKLHITTCPKVHKGELLNSKIPLYLNLPDTTQFLKIGYLNSNCIFAACSTTPIHDIFYYVRVMSIPVTHQWRKTEESASFLKYRITNKIGMIPVLGILLTFISSDTANFTEISYNRILHEDKPCLACAILRYIKVVIGIITFLLFVLSLLIKN